MGISINMIFPDSFNLREWNSPSGKTKHYLCYLPNSLITRRSGSKFKRIILKSIIWNSSVGTCWEVAVKWMPRNLSTGSGNAVTRPQCVNTLRPIPNGRHFADDIFKCIFLNENVWIPFQISLKFVPKVRINNIPALVRIMAWRRSGDKPLSEPMMARLLTHICVTRPQWVKYMLFGALLGPGNVAWTGIGYIPCLWLVHVGGLRMVV